MLRSPIVVVGLLDPQPTWACLRDAVERATATTPRPSCRVEAGLTQLGAAWSHHDEGTGVDC